MSARKHPVRQGRRLSPAAVSLWNVFTDWDDPTPLDELVHDLLKRNPPLMLDGPLLEEAVEELRRAGIVDVIEVDGRPSLGIANRHFLLPVELHDITDDGLLVFGILGRHPHPRVVEWAETVPVRDADWEKNYAGSRVLPRDLARALLQWLGDDDLPVIEGSVNDGVRFRAMREAGWTG